MKFINKRKNFNCPFEKVEFGEVFTPSDGNYFYLRIEGDDCKDEDENTVNAVDLSSGQLVYFRDNERVQVVDATLVVE